MQLRAVHVCFGPTHTLVVIVHVGATHFISMVSQPLVQRPKHSICPYFPEHRLRSPWNRLHALFSACGGYGVKFESIQLRMLEVFPPLGFFTHRRGDPHGVQSAPHETSRLLSADKVHTAPLQNISAHSSVYIRR